MRAVFAMAILLIVCTSSRAEFQRFLVATTEWQSGERFGDGSDHLPVIGFIPGQLVGSPSEDAGFYRLAPIAADHIVFPLYLIEDQALEASVELTGNSQYSKLTVVPAEAKFLRLATFFAKPGSSVFPGATIVDAESGSNVLVVYVDRPCRIEGTIAVEGTANVSLEFKEAGFHLVRSYSVGDEGKLENLPESTRLIYSGGN
ncbi:MAG: hypothetical protein AAFQ62_15945 [Pseudomonadota bacterium]